MDLRKNIPVQNDSPPSKGSKKAFFQLVGVLVFMFSFMFMFLGTSPRSNAPNNSTVKQMIDKKAQTNQPQQNIADANVQQNNSPQQKPADSNVQQNNSPQQKSVEQKPVEQKPVEKKVQTTQPQQKPKPTPPTSLPQQQPAPKPVSPPVSKPVTAAASASKNSSWLKKAGKIGIGIVTKGKVKIK